MTARSRPAFRRWSRGHAGIRAALLALVPTLMLASVAVPLALGAAPAPLDPDQPASAAAVRAAPGAPAVRDVVPASALGVDGTPDVIGGDDERVAVHSRITLDHRQAIAIASDGTLYAALAFDLGTTAWIGVHRSTDGGNTWSSWGGLSGVAGSFCDQPAIRVAEGDQDRVYVAYRYRASVAANADIRVAWSPFGTAAAWTQGIALHEPGVTFEWPSLDTDAVSYAGYALYLAAAGQDGNGMDVWFNRSGDFGASWEGSYRIATMSVATRDYRMPEVKYGWGGHVHCVYQFECRDGGADDAVRYRRALGRAAGGIGDWQTPIYLTSNADGRTEQYPSVAAAYSNMWTVIAYVTMRPDGVMHGTGLWASSDAGATWPAAYEDSLHAVYWVGVKALPGIEGFIGVGQTAVGELGVMRASNGLPLSWSAVQNLNDRSYHDGYAGQRAPAFDYDPAHGNRVGAVWSRCVAGVEGDTLFFDAEWLRDPGWPNYEAGMPMALASDPVSAPGICELDGDPQSEIVFSDAASNVQALNHDGSPVPGWPQYAAAVPDGSPVAVGDLDGDGHSEVVVGNANGWVYAWRHDGTPLAGWPVNLGFGAGSQGFVSLGALLPDSPLQVVVTSGTHEFVLLPNGSTAPGWPSYKVAVFGAPAAIGDVDDDGTNEVVALFGAYMNVQSPDGAVEHYRNLIAEGKTFAGAPSLADLDLDGYLEIVAPTSQGDIHVYRHDGTDQPGFPWHDVTTAALTSAALANIWGSGEPEIAFGSRDIDGPHVHLLDHHAAPVSTWPRPTMSGWFPAAPIMDVVDMTPGLRAYTVMTAAGDGYAHGWLNFGTEIPGWPKSLDASAAVSPASGDIDADGRLEVVVLTSSPARLQIVDLNTPIYRSLGMPRSWWPMYGYNHERQSCLACAPYAITWTPPAGSGLPGRLRFERPWPNPAHGSLSLRFTLPARSAVRLDVFDLGGRLVRPLLREELEAGAHELAWDGCTGGGEPAGAGVYYVRITCSSPAGEESQVRRVALLR